MASAISVGLSTPTRAEALDNEEQTFLTQINTYRAQNGLEPLTLSDKLGDVARWMANDMATHNYFSHVDSLGRDPFQRADDLGYKTNTWRGENLAAGAEGSAQAFQIWHDSPPHNDNMLDSHYVVIGVARAYSASSAFGWYWVTDFAGEDVSAPPPPAPAAAPAPEPAPVPELAPASASAKLTQLFSQPQVPTNTPEPTPAPPPVLTRHPVHSGLVFEGVPPIDFGHRTGGSFLSALLDLAPAVDRLLDRVFASSTSGQESSRWALPLRWLTRLRH